MATRPTSKQSDLLRRLIQSSPQPLLMVSGLEIQIARSLVKRGWVNLDENSFVRLTITLEKLAVYSSTERELRRYVYRAIAAWLSTSVRIDSDDDKFIDAIWPVQLKMAEEFARKAEKRP